MEREIFKSDRHFTVFGYSVSHGQLMLRSDKRKGYKENIDILFFDTTFIQLVAMLSGITIRIVDKSSIISYKTVAKYLSHEESNLFELESGGEKFYIAASFVKVYENELAFDETNLEMTHSGREKEIAGSR